MNGCLANTGLDSYLYIALAVAMMLAAATILWRNKNYRGVLSMVVVGALAWSLVAVPAFAAPANCKLIASKPDSSTGVLGVSQTYNVVGNDTPTEGSGFVLGSLTLGKVNGAVAGTTVSSDGKTVTVPGEGVYKANDNGTITFTPEPTFVGTAVGVVYTIKDTAGGVTSNTYVPTVTGSPVATCADPASQTRVLAARQIMNSTRTTPLVRESPHYFNATAIVQNTGKLYASADNLHIYTSTDGGLHWTALSGVTGTVPVDGLAATNDGSILVGKGAFGQAVVTISSDGGLTWGQSAYPAFTASGIQQVAAAGTSTLYVVTSNGALSALYVSSDGGTNWSQMTLDPSASVPTSFAVSPNGQHMVYNADLGGGSFQLMISHDAGATWTPTSAQPGSILVTDISNDGQRVVLADQLSIDGGASWTPFTIDGSLYSTSGMSFWLNSSHPFFSPNAQRIYAVGDYLLASDDLGATWQSIAGSQSIAAASIDIDPTLPGVQTTYTNAAEGWTATYDPVTDAYTVTIDDWDIYGALSGSPSFRYSISAQPNCTQPSFVQIQMIAPYFRIT